MMIDWWKCTHTQEEEKKMVTYKDITRDKFYNALRASMLHHQEALKCTKDNYLSFPISCEECALCRLFNVTHAETRGELYWAQLRGYGYSSRSSVGNFDPVEINLEYGNYKLYNRLEIKDGSIYTRFHFSPLGYFELDTTDEMITNDFRFYDNTPGNSEIFNKHSTDSGVNWSGLQRLTWNSGDSNHPSLASDSANGIHLVWYDSSPGNFEIFYKNRK